MIDIYSGNHILSEGAFKETLNKVASASLRKFGAGAVPVTIKLGALTPEGKSLTKSNKGLFKAASYEILIGASESDNPDLVKYLIASEIFLISLMESGDLSIGHNSSNKVTSFKYKGYSKAGNTKFVDLHYSKRPKIEESIRMGWVSVKESVGLCEIGRKMFPEEETPAKEEPKQVQKQIESIPKVTKPKAEVKDEEPVSVKDYVLNPNLSREEAYYELTTSAVAVEAKRLLNSPISEDREIRAKEKAILLQYEKNLEEFFRVYGKEPTKTKETHSEEVKAGKVRYSDIATAGKSSQWFKGQFHEAKGLNLDSALRGIEDMYGLVEVKAKIKEMFALKQLAKERGDSDDESGNHLLFFGNPGVGKTTVARLLGEIFREIGMLKTGQVVEVTGSSLIGSYTGQTAAHVKAAFEAAHGGVLLLDEIESIGEYEMYGQEAVSAIVKLAEDMRKDVIVIGAGYKEKTEAFLARDLGLSSRFSEMIQFPNYNADECKIIFMQMLKSVNAELALTYGAEEVLSSAIRTMIEIRGAAFGNARDMRQLLKKIRDTQASRVVKSGGAADKMIIEKEDIQLPSSVMQAS